MTENSYLHMVNNSQVTEVVDSHNYVSKYTFKVEATSSEKIVFYKYDIGNNYTYPIVNNNSIISVFADLAE